MVDGARGELALHGLEELLDVAGADELDRLRVDGEPRLTLARPARLWIGGTSVREVVVSGGVQPDAATEWNAPVEVALLAPLPHRTRLPRRARDASRSSRQPSRMPPQSRAAGNCSWTVGCRRSCPSRGRRASMPRTPMCSSRHRVRA